METKIANKEMMKSRMEVSEMCEAFETANPYLHSNKNFIGRFAKANGYHLVRQVVEGQTIYYYLKNKGSMNTTWVAVDKDSSEWIYSSKPERFNSDSWTNMGYKVALPHGAIEKIIGKKLTWDDEAVELVEK